MTDPSFPAVIEMVEVGMKTHYLTPASEPRLTNPVEVQEAVRGLNDGKAPDANDIPKRALKHLPQREVPNSGPDFQCGSLHPSLPYSVKARKSDVYT